MRSIRAYHISTKGWGDVAYHYFVGSDGQIYAGRDEAFQGDSGTKYDLDGRLLICFIGDFRAKLPTEAAIDALVRLIRHKKQQYRVPAHQVFTHRELGKTDCPGDKLHVWVDQNRGAVF